MFQSRLRRASRQGLTLVELMVAITVISLLAAISLPTVKSSLRGQKVSRASSMLKSAIEEGRARSIANGGGGGVIIDRVGTESASGRSEATRIRFANTLPPYRGDAGVNRCIVGVQPGTTVNLDQIALWFRPAAAQVYRSTEDYVQGSYPSLINVGDMLYLGEAGLPMKIQSFEFGSVSARNADRINASIIPDNDPSRNQGLVPVLSGPPFTGTSKPWLRVVVQRQERNLDMRRFLGSEQAFSITRSPRAAIAMPIELPKGTSIDLTSSGLGRDGNEFSPMAAEWKTGFPAPTGNYISNTDAPFVAGVRDYQSVWVLFGRRGEVSRVLSAQVTAPGGVPVLTDIPVTGDVHFLVGFGGDVKTELEDQLEDNDPAPLSDEADDGTTPLLNPESIWVTIKSRTGQVNSTPWVDPTVDDPAVDLIPAKPGTYTDALQEVRIRTVIGRVRSSAVSSRDLGSQ